MIAVDSLLLAAVGDVLIDREHPRGALSAVQPVLAGAHLVVGNFEGVMTAGHSVVPGGATATIVDPGQVAGLALFDLLSLANNHTMDAGYGGLRDTVAHLREAGISTVGAGADSHEAWSPQILTVDGIRVAFIGVTFVFKAGWEAKGTLGGLAALRTTEVWSARFPGVYGPGLAPRANVLVNEDDWARLSAAVALAREVADITVIQVHWGDHTSAWKTTEFERQTARRFADLGVHLVLGHHHHCLRGIEMIGSTLVCYGLGHLIFDNPRLMDEVSALGIDLRDVEDAELARRFGEYAVYPRKSSPGFPFHPVARNSVVALIDLGPEGPVGVGLAPVRIGADGMPFLPARGSEHWQEVVEVLERCAAQAHLDFELEDRSRLVGGCHVLDVRTTRNTPVS